MKFSLDRIRDSISALVKELSTGLSRLDFDNNFDSQKLTVTIAANTEAKIRHKFKDVPSGLLSVRQTGNALITDGPTAWTTQHIYLKNHDGSNSATITFYIFK